MFIDIHAHAYRKTPPFVCPFCTAEQLLEVYDKKGIDIGVVLPIVSPEIYFPQANEDILDMAAQYPDRLVPFCNIDPRLLTNSPNAPLDKVLQYYKDQGCKGLGEVMPNMELMNPLVQNLFRHAETVGMPVIYDGSDTKTGNFGLYDDPGLPQLEHTLQSFPNLFILGHGPVFWSEIAKLETPGERAYFFSIKGYQTGRVPNHPIKEEGVVPKLLRRYPNLGCDLSDFTAHNAMIRDPEYTFKFLDEFQDRIYFGTDYVSPTMPSTLIDQLREWHNMGKISDTVFNKISHQNAIKLLGL
ncbi:MAG: amidohydrolase family protein [Oscillospiraceae bacterium]|nr:amidohydrolase family protein [Oscillospiraceae bacterium]